MSGIISLILAAIATPWLTVLAIQSLDAKGGGIPTAVQLFALSGTTLFAFVLRWVLVSRDLGSGLRSFVRRCITWGVAGTMLWLALLFFAGSLNKLDRIFPFAYLAVLTTLLVSIELMCGPQLWAMLGALGVALAWAGWPSIAHLANGGANIQFIIEQLLAMPLIVPTTLVAAALISSAALRNAMADGANLVVASINITIWIVVTHFAWLLLLFALGTTDIPRWLPISTAMVMGILGVMVRLVWVLRSSNLGFAELLYLGNKPDLDDTRAELIPKTNLRSASSRRRAWVISYTGVSNEPRVLRQCEALVANGWDVVVCGYDGHSARPAEWNFVRLPASYPFGGKVQKLLSVTQTIARLLLVHGRPTGWFGWTAHIVHGATPLWFHTRQELVALAKAHPELRANLVIAHDYHSADAGFAVAQVFGAKFSIDIHEYAAGQYFNDPQWVKWERPVAIEVQHYYLGQADIVTVICKGIADLLAKEAVLKQRPVVIRSVPFKSIQPFRPVGSRIVVLHHGDLSVRREIHTLIESMRWWRKDIDLTLRGSGDPAYIADLKRQVERLNLDDRVRFEPPVPFDDIVPAANHADIGFFSFRGDSPQIRFTLPNKFFEYIMAGLCLCVGDTEEVGLLVRQYECGGLIQTHNPEAIAAAINSLTVEQIERYKKASIRAAEELNWEVEREHLMRAYESMLEVRDVVKDPTSPVDQSLYSRLT